jgi:hypothetical protein
MDRSVSSDSGRHGEALSTMRGIRERVAADGTGEPCRRAGARGGKRLIGPFATRINRERGAGDCLAGIGKSLDATDEIDVDRAKYENHGRLSDSNRISSTGRASRP